MNYVVNRFLIIQSVFQLAIKDIEFFPGEVDALAAGSQSVIGILLGCAGLIAVLSFMAGGLPGTAITDIGKAKSLLTDGIFDILSGFFTYGTVTFHFLGYGSGITVKKFSYGCGGCLMGSYLIIDDLSVFKVKVFKCFHIIDLLPNGNT